jgi:hypothetical protein
MIIEWFLDSGSVKKAKSTGRPTVATPHVVQNVNQKVEQNPHISVRRVSPQIVSINNQLVVPPFVHF